MYIFDTKYEPELICHSAFEETYIPPLLHCTLAALRKPSHKTNQPLLSYQLNLFLTDPSLNLKLSLKRSYFRTIQWTALLKSAIHGGNY